jgi:hypothetical protein
MNTVRSSMDNVHRLHPEPERSGAGDQRKLVEQIATLEARQEARRQFVAEHERLMEKKQLEIDNLRAQLEQVDA